MISIQREIFSVEQKIKCFTTAHVNLDLKEEIPARLEKIDDCNVACQEKIFDLIMTLDDNVPSDLEKTNSLRKLADDLNSKVLNKSVQVREKLADLMKNKPFTLAEQEAFDHQKEKGEREESARQSKIVAKLKNHSEDCTKLSKEVSARKDVEEMSEQEIRSALLEWKEVWDKKLDKLKERRDTIEENYLHDIDDENEQVVAFRNDYNQAVKDVSDKYNSLIAKDQKLGLYTLAPNKSKESVCYPKVFSGKCGENVHKFVADIKAAMEENQVRVKDEVKTLRKYLDGDAKTCIGENILTWKKHIETMDKSIIKHSWVKNNSTERRNTISKVIEFLNEAMTLTKEHSDLERIIVSDSTLSFVHQLIPKDIEEEIVDKIDKSEEKVSVEDKTLL